MARRKIERALPEKGYDEGKVVVFGKDGDWPVTGCIQKMTQQTKIIKSTLTGYVRRQNRIGRGGCQKIRRIWKKTKRSWRTQRRQLERIRSITREKNRLRKEVEVEVEGLFACCDGDLQKDINYDETQGITMNTNTVEGFTSNLRRLEGESSWSGELNDDFEPPTLNARFSTWISSTPDDVTDRQIPNTSTKDETFGSGVRAHLRWLLSKTHLYIIKKISSTQHNQRTRTKIIRNRRLTAKKNSRENP